MMRYLTGSGIGLGLLALAVMGCSHDPAMATAKSVEASGFRQTVGGVQVVVDPLFGRERAGAEFPGGEAFEEQGLLPVQILIENGSRQPVRADRADFRLVRPRGQSDVALSPQDAFATVKPPVGWWATLPILGPSAAAYRNSDWLKQFEARALKDIPVAAGGAAVGLVYFYFPESEKKLTGTRVVLVLRGESGKSGISTSPCRGGAASWTPPRQPPRRPGRTSRPSPRRRRRASTGRAAA